MNKRGEITSSQLVALVMAIVGFVVVLILLFSLEFENYSDDEICRLSVISRASVPSPAAGNVPLKCTTNKICITDKAFGGKCEQFAGENDIRYVKLSGDDDSKAREIEKTMAEAMYNCWSMMGEGKLDILNRAGVNAEDLFEETFNLNDAQPSCVICSRVALDDDVLENEDLLDKVDFNSYLERNGPPGSSLTYLQLFTDRQVRAFPKEFKEDFGNSEKHKKATDQMAFLFMQISTKTDPGEQFLSGLVGGAGFVFGTTYAVGGIGAVFNAPAAVIAAMGGLVTGGLRAVGSVRDQSISAGYCGQFSDGNKAKDKYGCSIVAPVDYNNIGEVNKLCKVIEGYP